MIPLLSALWLLAPAAYIVGSAVYLIGWSLGYRARETEELTMYRDTRSARDRHEGVPERRAN